MKALWALIAAGTILLHIVPVAEAGHQSYAICPDAQGIVTDAHRQLPVDCRPIIVDEAYDSWEDLGPAIDDWTVV